MLKQFKLHKSHQGVYLKKGIRHAACVLARYLCSDNLVVTCIVSNKYASGIGEQWIVWKICVDCQKKKVKKQIVNCGGLFNWLQKYSISKIGLSLARLLQNQKIWTKLPIKGLLIMIYKQ